MVSRPERMLLSPEAKDDEDSIHTEIDYLSGPSDEWIDILTKYQSLLLRELKYHDMNGYSRYGLYKLHNQS